MLESAALFGPGIVVPMPHAPRLALPLDTVKISAGFPSPAADYEDKCQRRFKTDTVFS